MCYGNNFSHLIIYKLVASMLQAYDVRGPSRILASVLWITRLMCKILLLQIQLADPNAKWRSEGRWFAVQKDLHVKLARRA